MREVQEYPYDRWPRVSAREAAMLRSWARAAPLEALARGARSAEWLGARPIVTVGAPAIAPLDREPECAVLLEDGSGVRAALVLDAAIASAVADRAVGGDGEGLEAAIGSLRDIELGLVAYVIARWLAEGESSFRVATVLSSRAAIELALGEAPYVRWPLDLAIGKARGHAALWLRATATPTRAERSNVRIDGLSVEVIVRAGRARLMARELSELGVGDVVVLDACSLAIGGHGIEGRADIAVGRGRWAWRARIEAGALRIESEGLGVESADGPREANVDDAKKVLDKLGDTPVTLTLELARFTMPLADLASLAPGEVLRTGHPIGEPVALRAGDRTIAIGELVDVDGEIGVRVTEITGAAGP